MWEDNLITAGVPGLVGIAGILGTFFAPAWAQRALARRGEVRAFRVARRLVLEELETVEIHFGLLIEQGKLPVQMSAELLPTEQWKRYRHVLAEALSDEDWEGIPTVIDTFPHHRMILLTGSPEVPLSPEQLKRAKEAAELIHEVRLHLLQAQPVKD